MARAVPREEGNGNTVVLEDVDGRRGVAPWCKRVNSCAGRVAFEGLQTSAADYCDMDNA